MVSVWADEGLSISEGGKGVDEESIGVVQGIKLKGFSTDLATSLSPRVVGDGCFSESQLLDGGGY